MTKINTNYLFGWNKLRFRSFGDVVFRNSSGNNPPPTFAAALARRGFFLVRPAGRTYLEVKVLYTPDKGKC
jgi:hypothetical protein